MSARFHKLGPLLSGENSRAVLAIAADTVEPRVLIWLHEDVVNDPDAMQAVRRETRRAEQLEHPHIIRVFGLDEGADGIARVVEYADAESLRRLLQAAVVLPPPLAARIAIDAATGLHYAHVAGNDDGTPLVHGDLRPETLLVGYSGVTKVSGYGALAAAPREPGGRRVMGRRQHCAPEQVVGGREAVNIQTDVYLLGVLLFELLSGKVPYGDLPLNEFDTAVLTHPTPPLPVADRPAGLEAVLRRAMAKKAFDRYPTPLAFREAVERAMEGAIASPEEVARFVGELFPEEGRSPRAERRRMIDAAVAHLKAGGTPETIPAPAAPGPGPLTSGPRAIPSSLSAPRSTSDLPATSGPRAIGASGTPPAGTSGIGGSAATGAAGVGGRDATGSTAGSGAAPVAGAPTVGTTPSGPNGNPAAAITGAPTVSTTAPGPTSPSTTTPAPGTAGPTPSPATSSRRSSAPLFAGLLLGLLAVGAFWAYRTGLFARAESPPVANPPVAEVPAADAGADAGALAEPTPDAGTTAVATAPGDAGPSLPILDLFVDPPVEVELDGEPIGRAPLRHTVEAGRHTLRLVDKRQLINVTRVVEVPPEGARREIYLSRGYVKVIAPEGSDVFIDGKPYGKAPLTEVGLFEGPHQLVVMVAQLKWQESFTLKPNERLRFVVDFQ